MANKYFPLRILSPQGTIYDGEVESVSLPGYSGMITILSGHMPLLTRLEEGEIEIRNESSSVSVVTSGGFLEIKNNTALVLSDYAIRAESIEIAMAEEKKREAEDKLREKRDMTGFTQAEKALRISTLELKIAAKMRKRRGI
jgi:F-type H+-transporting ATPase subunit epsilon